ncbi:MAG: MerR family transcriptional regulator, partial [Chloroflexia bacterium]|nr:MerR family transcriptional regulator [Chloroflexia bacterium]
MGGTTRVGTYSIGEVARLAGVTVRTLHHYGEIGLLAPSGRTSAGYRQYSAADLDRLSRILFYRELGFPIDRIAALLEDPAADPVDHLRRQRELLTERLRRTAAMLAAVNKELEAQMTGITLTSEEKLEIFGASYGASYKEEWETEAEERWGDTDARKQSRARSAAFTKDDWVRYGAETDALHAKLVAGFGAGYGPESAEAMALVEAHRQWVSLMWDCG